MLATHDPASGAKAAAAPGSRADVDWNAIRALGVRRLTGDSRMVIPGDAFVAYPGEVRDGREFIPDAIARGASAVIWERQGYRWDPAWKVPNVGVKRLRRHAGEIASDFYANPSAKLWMVGVTGTNGKTSCSHWIAQSLSRLGRRCGVIGTLGSGSPGKLEPLANTTPDALWLHARLREFLKQRAQAVSMEVSSHGLAQDRVSGVEFDVALFTNLTRDHLDYHRTMRNYRSAKARLFEAPGLKHAVVNLDDPFGAELAKLALGRGVHVVGYGFERAVPQALRGKRVQRVLARDLTLTAEGLSFHVTTPWGDGVLDSPLLGRFNAANLLATLAVLLASEYPIDPALAALHEAKPVPGRMERFGGGRKPLVVVDYAHTPDALENVLRALRDTVAPMSERRAGKLVCVFGCGGDRDRGKRPMMGRIATRFADEVVITSDNPRSEDPHAIITDILAGITRQCAIAPDRAQAIRAAVAGARSGDVILIAGKGHEPYQEIGGVKRPYSDAATVRAALAERTG